MIRFRCCPLVFAAILVLVVSGVSAASESRHATAAPDAVIPADFSCDAVTQIPQTECQALVALYDSANGPGWKTRTGWLSTNTPCNWYGVSCVAGHVQSLSLSHNQLA